MTNQWIQTLFSNIDAKDTEGFLSYLTEDAVFRFGNADALVGKPNIKAAVDQFFASIDSSTHEIRSVFPANNSVACHGTVTYTKLDGSEITVPFANVFYTQADNRIREYLIHIDLTPLHNSG